MSEIFDTANYVPIIVSPKVTDRERLRIYSISDLHLEFYPNHRDLWKVISPFLPNADILILAGDIGIAYGIKGYDEYTSLLLLFKQKYENVILVPGNHEYYKTKKYDIVTVTDTLRKMCDETGVVLLSNNMAKIKDVYFIGTTLWTKAESHIRHFMSDFGKVFPDVPTYNKEFQRCYDWLKKTLDETHETIQNNRCDDRIVVITHHLPSKHLIHEKYSSGLFNSGYYTDILQDLKLDNVDLWLSGHTHESIIYEYEKPNTDILTIGINPVGYPSEPRETKTFISTYTIASTKINE